MRNKEQLYERAENMRKKPTFHENKFRERLELAGLFFKQQWVIGNYIVDFLIGRTVIEIDGASHYETFQALYDEDRTRYLKGRGYTVIRVRNEHVVSFDMNILKEKKAKMPKRTPEQRETDKKKLKEDKERLKEEAKMRMKANKEKGSSRAVIITPGATKQPDKNKIRFTYATLKKGA